MDTCDINASSKNRTDCFVAFGLDSERVDTYYDVVELFEESVKKGRPQLLQG